MFDRIEKGLCHCGCGQTTRLIPKTMKSRGWIRGEFLRFICGHNGRLRPSGIIKYEIDPNTGCWLWLRSKTSMGYGNLTIKNKQILAHRYVYEKFKGPIPEGLTLDHSCRNPICVNPDHTEPVTHAENCRRGKRAKLNHEVVAIIKKMKVYGWKSIDIAKFFKVERNTILTALRGQSWASQK